MDLLHMSWFTQPHSEDVSSPISLNSHDCRDWKYWANNEAMIVATKQSYRSLASFPFGISAGWQRDPVQHLDP